LLDRSQKDQQRAKFLKFKIKEQAVVYFKHIFLALFCGALFCGALYGENPNKISKQNFKSDFIWGVTIDDGWYEDVQDTSGAKLQSIVRALQALPVKPTVRVVMSKEISPREYEPLFRRLSEVSYVMACPVDSYEMSSYKSVKSYEKRFSDAFAALAPYVAIWEIGNEINGEGWLGDDANFIAAKMIAAFEFIHKKGAKTALTAYYTPSRVQKIEMREWLRKFVPQDMKDGLDYLFVSYYEDDNEGFAPDWAHDADGQRVAADGWYAMQPENATRAVDNSATGNANEAIVRGDVLLALGAGDERAAVDWASARAATRLLLDFKLPDELHSRKVLQQLNGLKRGLKAA